MTNRAPLTPRPPPPLADKLRRALWQMIWLILFRPSPVLLHGWRRLILRAFGATVGPGAAIYPGVRIFSPWMLTVGPNAAIGPGATLYSVGRITLGPRAIVSQGAHLCTASHDITSPGFTLITAPITLESDAWVAAEAFIGPGVTLHEGAVAAARACVTRSIAARRIMAGNPARDIGARAEEGRNVLGKDSKQMKE